MSFTEEEIRLSEKAWEGDKLMRLASFEEYVLNKLGEMECDFRNHPLTNGMHTHDGVARVLLDLRMDFESHARRLVMEEFNYVIGNLSPEQIKNVTDFAKDLYQRDLEENE